MWNTAAGSLGNIGKIAITPITLSASDASNITYSLPSGNNLPSGLSLSSSGVISGTTTASNGTYNFTVRATAGGMSADRSFSLNVGGTIVTFICSVSGSYPPAYCESIWTVPVGVSRVFIQLWGGGGANCNYSPYNGGGAGGYTEGYIDVIPGEQLGYIVGNVYKEYSTSVYNTSGTPGYLSSIKKSGIVKFIAGGGGSCGLGGGIAQAGAGGGIVGQNAWGWGDSDVGGKGATQTSVGANGALVGSTCPLFRGGEGYQTGGMGAGWCGTSTSYGGGGGGGSGYISTDVINGTTITGNVATSGGVGKPNYDANYGNGGQGGRIVITY